ncbi:hypothetical protein [Halorubrum salsamenti]|uniref:hypothetical protein n=1 Tax=Halorubrum salsamenti TaxID=2583990 RepID=UPI00119D3AD2|nr:hypothetical protein [Halorubrum salsamenti]
MVRQELLSRRRLLAGLTSGPALVALSGCTGDGGSDPTTDDSDSEDGTESDSEDGSTVESPAGGDIDLREANVVAVAFEETDGGHAFDVTLHHDDGGEEGYANWWQIERLDGTRLGRRELLHAHSEQPFTRSETVDVPDDVSCLVVRGHDQTHGYGGVAAAVDLDGGAVRRVDQGSDPRTFDASDCP